MTMKTAKCSVFGVGIMLIALFAATITWAQDVTGADDEIGPAVDTSAAELTREAEIDELQPGVSSPELSSGITRSTTGVRVMDSIELGRTEITGNQELPKVLYIVPWKKADPGDLMGRPVNTLLDEVLAPIDREEFIRQVGYYDDLNDGEEE